MSILLVYYQLMLHTLSISHDLTTSETLSASSERESWEGETKSHNNRRKERDMIKCLCDCTLNQVMHMYFLGGMLRHLVLDCGYQTQAHCHF